MVMFILPAIIFRGAMSACNITIQTHYTIQGINITIQFVVLYIVLLWQFFFFIINLICLFFFFQFCYSKIDLIQNCLHNHILFAHIKCYIQDCYTAIREIEIILFNNITQLKVIRTRSIIKNINISIFKLGSRSLFNKFKFK